MADVAEQLSEVIGNPVQYVNVPPQDKREKMLIDAGLPAMYADALDELFADRRQGNLRYQC